MATPEFILALREKVGTDPLWLSGVTAVVVRGDDLLLVRRADNQEWTPVTGIIDPGEEPAVAAAREVVEEADVHAVVERLAWVHATGMRTYPNGDRTSYIDIVFRLRWESGEPRPADGENTEARWFPRDALPPMSRDTAQRIEAALDPEPAARFVPFDD
ncbi:NUDIX hydrolase [Aeromicrobium wangtongii]|uniref:NUDIX domain-containing protein n=1 Tax=Aeromicrobium wangtongii TaxID=2969247 RepID=A0ABY5M5F9_9ACTN|nr:NUDIX domain-containing protein [Aeromicrobium wangtongii]MCD9200145.1 NUDIX domain-containing protein [Aeromicrobium wangtongii]UUP13400.1 NUDIX domain-containing protein [Aeromicrobium wangtongii]